MSMLKTHIRYMNIALGEAEKAMQKDEVPIGAVLVDKTGQIIASDHNRVICMADPTAHAEILSIRQSAYKISNYRLLNTTLYVTIEPCMMCMGAIVHARISRLVFGAYDPKWGSAGSLYDFSHDKRLNHRLEIISGVCKSESKNLIQSFFKNKRKT
jgi:tRNA(adenine34) deaminase